ncbi:MAG: hypothetical protein LQ346_006818 [Caloplaca aetnensis]|nr:MAG: hypothetical protein LQ346_006818 [Caloplaca aetnensis]
MAAVMNESPLLDPHRSAKVPVTLGPDLIRGGASSEQRNASIQCKPQIESMRRFRLRVAGNFKPRLQSENSAKIKSSSRRSSNSRVSLMLHNQDDTLGYHYTGTQQPSESCALIYDPSKKSFVLEKLDVDFTFNLQTAPANQNGSQVTSQYPQLDTGASDVESDAGSTAEAAPPNGIDSTEADSNNPYDYRHFLKRRRTSSPEPPTVRPSVSPAVPPRRISRTNTKPKARPRPTQRPKRPAQEEAKATGNDSDDGGLTIDMGDSPRPRRFGNGAVVFNHDKRNGPISLRSAASSMSPASVRHDSEDEVESDNDVEHLQLPSPHAQPKAEEEEEVGDEDDDHDDLVEDLMQAMESQEEEEATNAEPHDQQQTIRRTIEESSSESEEE